MKKKITIIGAGMMGSALAFPAAENGHEVHIVGTCLDDEIIDGYIAAGKHEKFCRPFPESFQKIFQHRIYVYGILFTDAVLL